MPANPNSIVLRVVQVDALGNSPWDEPVSVLSDGIKLGAVFLVESGKDDTLAALWRDGNSLRFRDETNPGVAGSGHTLTELLAGAAGITENQHKALRQLIHFIDSGPAEGFATNAYAEILPSGNPFPTSVIWWESSSKIKKIVELTATRNANKTPATEVWKMYDTNGSTVLVTVTDTISYSGVFETSRIRTIV